MYYTNLHALEYSTVAFLLRSLPDGGKKNINKNINLHFYLEQKKKRKKTTISTDCYIDNIIYRLCLYTINLKDRFTLCKNIKTK